MLGLIFHQGNRANPTISIPERHVPLEIMDDPNKPYRVLSLFFDWLSVIEKIIPYVIESSPWKLSTLEIKGLGSLR